MKVFADGMFLLGTMFIALVLRMSNVSGVKLLEGVAAKAVEIVVETTVCPPGSTMHQQTTAYLTILLLL